MTIQHPLSTDGLAILALTARSSSGTTRTADGQVGPDPLTPKEWSRVAAALLVAGETPSALLGREANDLHSMLAASGVSTEMIARLMGRATTLAMEVERLESRGIWLVTTADEAYPRRVRAHLAASAPPALYGAGSVDLLQAGGVAIVGARDADSSAIEFAAETAASVARSGRPVISGGAKGVDAAALNGAAEAGGSVVGVLAESLERKTRSAALRNLVADERVALISPYGSDVPFSVGAAMGRNRLIYCLADVAVVVSASRGEGGTWAGATEALKAGWVPIYTRIGNGLPAGNAALVALGARAYGGDPAMLASLSAEPDAYRHAEADPEQDQALIAEQKGFFDIDGVPPAPKAAKRSASRRPRKSRANPLGA
jgi:predicted Rossmann fold nucleotide-binding protein DprA/Smf involved in DNA uptake